MRGFLFGTMIGALAAMLVAPRRGEETREMVKARVGFWQDQLMSKMDNVSSDVTSLRHDMMARLEDIRAQFGRGGEAPGRMEGPGGATATRPAGEGEFRPETPGGEL